MTKRAGVMGDPVAHSLSPKLHNYWLKQYAIDGAYDALHVKPHNLRESLEGLNKSGFAGVNLTIPHKEAALELMNDVSDVARRIGAVNTVVVKDGLLYGDNTDAIGFISNLKQHSGDVHAHKHKAVVLGAGGASRAVCVALQDEGFERIVIVNRTREKAEALAYAMGGSVCADDWDNRAALLDGAGLVVNTTSLGMAGKEPLELPLDALASDAMVTDIVYAPLYTPLLENARARGNIVVTGLGMLIHQAVPGFEAWFGVRPQVSDGLEDYLLS